MQRILLVAIFTLNSCIQFDPKGGPQPKADAHTGSTYDAPEYENSQDGPPGVAKNKIEGLHHDEAIKYANDMKKEDYKKVVDGRTITLCGVGSRRILNKLFGRPVDAPYPKGGAPHACMVDETELNGLAARSGYKYVAKSAGEIKGGVPEGTVVVCGNAGKKCDGVTKGSAGHIEVLMGGTYQSGITRLAKPFCSPANGKSPIIFYVLEKVT